MSWLSELFFGQGIAHSVLMFAIVIALGIVLGKDFFGDNLDSFCGDYL